MQTKLLADGASEVCTEQKCSEKDIGTQPDRLTMQPWFKLRLRPSAFYIALDTPSSQTIAALDCK